MSSLSLSLNDFQGTQIEKSFTNDLVKAKAVPVGTINKYKEMKMPDGSWKYVGDQGHSHPAAQAISHLITVPKVESKVKEKNYFSQYRDNAAKISDLEEQEDLYWHTVTDSGKKKLKGIQKELRVLYQQQVEIEDKFSQKDINDYEEHYGVRFESKSGTNKVQEKIDSVIEQLTPNVHESDLVKNFPHDSDRDARTSSVLQLLPEMTDEDFENLILRHKDAFSEAVDRLLKSEERDDFVGSLYNKHVRELRDGLKYLDSNPPKADKKEYADYSKCTSSQISLIRQYTGDTFFPAINNYCLGKLDISHNPKLNIIFNKVRNTIDKGLSNIVNNDDNLGTLTRIYKPSRHEIEDVRRQKVKEVLVDALMKKGTPYENGFFMSTSVGDTGFHSEGSIDILYTVEDNKTGKYIQDISMHSDANEHEVLFPTTAKFSVLEVKSTSTAEPTSGTSKVAHNIIKLKEVL